MIPQESELTESQECPGYRWWETTSKYGGIEQRWLVVESEQRQESDIKRLEEKIIKSEQEASQRLRKLARVANLRLHSEEFGCEADALAAAAKVSRQLKFHQLTEITASIPANSKRKKPIDKPYRIQVRLEENAEAIATEKRKASRFILATNVLDSKQLSSDEMLVNYKDQQASERGFSFLKDPLFFTSSVFLKSPRRIEALALIMGLCLLVYKLAQRQLRKTLKEQEATMKNQVGKGTERPTMRRAAMPDAGSGIQAARVQGMTNGSKAFSCKAHSAQTSKIKSPLV